MNMPVTYTIDTKEKVIRTKCFGIVTLAEVLDHFRVLEHDPDCVEYLDVLLDLGETNSVPEPRQIQAVLHEVEKIQKKVRFDACAIVAVRDALFGMMRMFETLAERYFRVTHVFRATDEAEIWLVLQRQQSSGHSLEDERIPDKVAS